MQRRFTKGIRTEGEGRRATLDERRDTFDSSAPVEYLINRVVINDASRALPSISSRTFLKAPALARRDPSISI